MPMRTCTGRGGRSVFGVGLLAALLLAGTSGGDTAGALQVPGVPELFARPRAEVAVAPVFYPEDPKVRRVRLVRLNQGLLVALGRQGDRLRLNLFDDVSFVAVLDSIDDDPLVGYAWRGHLEGVEHSLAVFVVHEGVVGGGVSYPGAYYRIRRAGEGLYRVEELDLLAFPTPERDYLVPPVPPREEGRPPPVPAAGKKTVVDVLMLYTARAARAAGGKGALIALIKVAVQEWNTALRRSKADRLTIRAVKYKKIAYTENNDLEDALRRITQRGDGFMDRAHKWRGRYGGDLVALVTADNDPSACGIAWLGGNRSGMPASDEAWAFNVTRWDCLPFQTLPHEGSHNMGCFHDRETDANLINSPRGAFDYSFGYRKPGKFRTIMAYPCSGTPCPQILNFSNPKVREGGTRTGVPFRRKNAADNARSLTKVRAAVAAFRPCKVRCG